MVDVTGKVNPAYPIGMDSGMTTLVVPYLLGRAGNFLNFGALGNLSLPSRPRRKFSHSGSLGKLVLGIRQEEAV